MYKYTGKNVSDSCIWSFLEIYDNIVIFLADSNTELNFLRPEVIGGFVESYCEVLVDLCRTERSSLRSRRSRKSTQQPSPVVGNIISPDSKPLGILD